MNWPMDISTKIAKKKAKLEVLLKKVAVLENKIAQLEQCEK